MANWIKVNAKWHILGLVDKPGWITVCGLIVTDDATVVDEEPPFAEPQCIRCLDADRDPAP